MFIKQSFMEAFMGWEIFSQEEGKKATIADLKQGSQN